MKVRWYFIGLVLMFIIIAGCSSQIHKDKPSVPISANIHETTSLPTDHPDEDELLYGKVSDFLLKGIQYNLHSNKSITVDYKSITRGDLKNIKFFFLEGDDLRKEWGFNPNEIYDLSIIEDMPNLESMQISGIKLKDYDIFKNNNSLGSLGISYIDDEKANALIGLTNLKGLTITDSTMTSIDFVSKMEKLWFFALDNVPDIKSYAVLQSMTSLKYLEISNMFDNDDLKRLPNMENLTELRLTNNAGLTNISVLPYAPSLSALFLDGSGVKEISLPVDKVPDLGMLSVADTPIDSIAKIKGLDNMASINMVGSKIKDVFPIKVMKEKGLLKRIQVIYIDNNFERNRDILKGTGIEIENIYMGQ